MPAWRSAVHRSVRSAPGSPRSPASLPRSTAPSTIMTSRSFRPASPKSHLRPRRTAAAAVAALHAEVPVTAGHRAGSKKRCRPRPTRTVDRHDHRRLHHVHLQCTIPMLRSASTATRSASRFATTSPRASSGGSPSVPPVRTSTSCSPIRNGGRSEADGDALLALVTKGSMQAAIFRADDLDTTFETVRASGAEILQEPKSQPWGARDCAVRDPSGNLVRIAQA